MNYKLKINKEELSVPDLKSLNESVGSRPRPLEKWTRALSYSPCVAYAVDNNNELIGFGRVEQNDPIPLIYDMCVNPEYQGSGVGSAVFTSLIEQARELGIQKIGLGAWTPRARDFYLKHGVRDSKMNPEIKNYMEIIVT